MDLEIGYVAILEVSVHVLEKPFYLRNSISLLQIKEGGSMHRVSGVWKEQYPKSLPYQSQVSQSKHNKHENHWEKSHRIWLGIAVFLFLFTVCLFTIPATLDMSIDGQGLVPVLERKRDLQLWSTSVLSKHLEVQQEEIRSVQGRIGGWTLKSNHFTLFNHLSKITPQVLSTLWYIH